MHLGKAGLVTEYSRRGKAITHNNPTLRQMRRNRMNKNEIGRIEMNAIGDIIAILRSRSSWI